MFFIKLNPNLMKQSLMDLMNVKVLPGLCTVCVLWEVKALHCRMRAVGTNTVSHVLLTN